MAKKPAHSKRYFLANKPLLVAVVCLQRRKFTRGKRGSQENKGETTANNTIYSAISIRVSFNFTC